MAGMTPEKYASMWTLDADATADSLLAAYDAACGRERRAGAHRRPGRRPCAPRGAVVRAGRPVVGPRVLVHVIAETAQHAGHADIVREAIDGQKTMG